MSTDLLPSTSAKLPDGYPFHIGTRLVNHRDSAGRIVGHEYLPLTEEDFLHPQEEDRFILTDRHTVSLNYLNHALAIGLRDRTGTRAFSEHRIDWQHPGIEPHGPDAVVFDRFTAEYDDLSGTLPVKDVGAEVVAVFEVTSEATRHIDFGAKFDEFIEVGVPYYIVIDAAAPNGVPVVMGFRLVNSGYRTMRNDPKLGVRLPELKLWFRWQGDRLIVADETGKDIPASRELGLAYDAEKARAEAEKGRADALALEVTELKAKLAGPQ